MRDEINEALKAAMKARDAARTSTLRMISAAFKERDILARGEGRGEASGEALLAVLGKMIKQREESAKAFEAGKRPELAEKERAEIEVIRGFMPAQMADAEIDAAVEAAITDAGAAAARDIGKVMALLKERHQGKMDFGKASAAVKRRLA